MENQKTRQVLYHEREHFRPSEPRHADNCNPLIAWLNGYRLRTMLEMIGKPLAGKSVLTVCGGDGEEADSLERIGATVTMTDLSLAGVEAARTRNPRLLCFRMDSERLAFPDRSFDWVIAREGLHHLARPTLGLYEMERVAREGFAFMEGQDSLAVRFLTAIGVGDSWDPAGGYVYRFSRREIRKIFASVQTVAEYRIHTAWLPYGNDVLRLFPAFRRSVYPVINWPPVLRVLASRPGRRILKSLFACLSFLIGRPGNCLIVVAWKKAPPGH